MGIRRDVLKNAVKFICKNFKSVTETTYFLSLDKDIIAELLRNNNIYGRRKMFSIPYGSGLDMIRSNYRAIELRSRIVPFHSSEFTENCKLQHFTFLRSECIFF